MVTKTEYLVYAWLDEKGSPFYVGRTNCLKTRNRHHQWRMNIGITLPKYNKLRKLIREGHTWNIKVLENGIDKKDINDREIHWIAYWKKQPGIKLYNLTDGGEGANFTPEQHKAMAEKRRGQKRTPETRKRMSEARMGMKFSKEHKKNLSKARKTRITTQETRDKASKTSTGKINIKRYECVDPEGNIFTTTNGLTQFCRENGLTPSLMSKVANGERPYHKGWGCRRL